MTRDNFDASVTELRAAVICTVQTHFEQRKFAFDMGRFLAETQVDLDLFLKEAFFLGAEVFPIDPPQE